MSDMNPQEGEQTDASEQAPPRDPFADDGGEQDDEDDEQNETAAPPQ